MPVSIITDTALATTLGPASRPVPIPVPVAAPVALDDLAAATRAIAARAERLDPGDQAAQARLGAVDGLGGEVELAAVVAAQQEQPVGHRVIAIGDEVGQPRHRAR